MERVHSSPLVEKVPTFLEQIEQRRRQAREEKAQAELEQAKKKEQEWQEFLETSASPLKDGTPEQDFVVQICKKKILDGCNQVSGMFFELPNDDLQSAFPKWPVKNAASCPSHYEKTQRFYNECLANLAAALERENLSTSLRLQSNSLWIQWPRH